LFPSFFKYHAIKIYTCKWVKIQTLNSTIVEVECLALSHGLFNPGITTPDSHCLGGWVKSRIGLEAFFNREICDAVGSLPFAQSFSPYLHH
jgi:hypothetical protein